MPLSAVILDAGGVLLVPHREPVTQALTAAHIDVGPFDAELAHASGIAAIDDPSSQADFKPGYLFAFAEAIGVHSDDRQRAVDALMQLWTRPAIDIWRHVIAHSVEGMRMLAARHVPLAVVSNADGTVEAQMQTHGICQVGEGAGVSVRAIVDSAVVGVEKPDPRVFASAIAAVGCPPEDIAYVGDTVRYDVVGSRNAGLVPIHFDPFGMCGGWDEHRHIASLAELAASLH